MKLKIYISFILLIVGFGAFAQSSITGKVMDSVSGNPLYGANIIILELQAGTSTDASGAYTINNLKPGKYTLTASYLGYSNNSLVLNVEENEKLVINFQLKASDIKMSSVVITATRTHRQLENVPARMSMMDVNQIENYPATDIDDALNSISNVLVNRSWGIFSKNTSVTMRGLDGTSRTLILLNGVPLNKVSGGQIQWALVRPEDVERIEVLKGPGSALYGMNAMGGVINVLTKQPNQDLQLSAELQLGSMDTYGGHFSLSKDESIDGKGLYWGINGFYRQGQGYIIEPEEIRDSTDVKAYLYEGNVSALLGYNFNSRHKLEIAYDFHDEKRGDGRQVFEEDGGYNRYQIYYTRAKYDGLIGGTQLSANAFVQIENYDRQSESVNSTGVYRLYNTDSYKEDRGIWMSLSKEWIKNNRITIGLDLHDGLVDSKDIYLTSTDEIQYKGKLSFAGIFAQDEVNLAAGKIKLIAGLRMDMANYRDGSLQVFDPTSTTGFPEQSSEEFANNTWTSFSPKLSGMYFFSNTVSSYLSFATGFNPPKLDDLSKSGKISKGFKLANPELSPETIITYEWGLNWKALPNLSFEPSLYYSQGHDFQYFVPTGDSIDTGGSSIKPVLQRQNISEVEILGFEMNIGWQALKTISVNAWYAYNHSQIKALDVNDENPTKQLEGKFLAEVPRHTAFVSVGWQNKIINTTLTTNYVGNMWADEYNTLEIDDYWMFDINLWKQITNHWRISLIVQDVFDRQPIDKKMRLSPGRYFMGKIQYQL